MSGTTIGTGDAPGSSRAEDGPLDAAITEGLELLALFRRVENPSVRTSVIEFLRNLVAADA
jgi:hypothetical protein